MSAEAFRSYLERREVELVALGYHYCSICGAWVLGRCRCDQPPPPPRRRNETQSSAYIHAVSTSS